MTDKPERGLGGYNKRSDYGEIDKAGKIQKDETVHFATEKDIIYLAKVKCLITKITIKKRGNQVTSRKTEKRDWETETFYHEGEELLTLGLFQQKVSKIAQLKDSETLEVKEVIKIKPIGLLT